MTSIEISAIEKDNAIAGSESNTPLRIPENSIPSSENNPYVKESWNTDAQRQLHDSNPIQAQKSMREAGILK